MGARRTRPICVLMPVKAKYAGRSQHQWSTRWSCTESFFGHGAIVRDNRAEQEAPNRA